MSKYLIAVEPEFFPQYDSLPKEIKKKFKKLLTCLKDNPKHNSLQMHKLEGTTSGNFMLTRAIVVSLNKRVIFSSFIL